jgi:hypothetical protein
MYKEIDNLKETYKAILGIINLIENNNKFSISQKKQILSYFLKRKKIVLNQLQKFFKQSKKTTK